MKDAGKQVLVIGPSWIGDMVMAQSLFMLLANKGMLVDVLAPAWSHPLLARMPEVRRAINMPVKRGELGLRKRWKLTRRLRSFAYDQAIILPNSFKSALIPWWAGIAIRTGWRGEMRWGLLNDVRYLDKRQLPLMVQRFTMLGQNAKQAPCAHWPIPKLLVQATQVSTTLAKLNVAYPQASLTILCPGAEFGPSKQWPAAYFAEVANYLLARGQPVWLMGSDHDRAIATEIMGLTAQACLNLTGKTSLEQAIDLMSLATHVVSNDSGLMHIAAGLNLHTIVLYGSTSPGFTPPLHGKAAILSAKVKCSPCFKRQCPLLHHRCMQDLGSDRVIAAIDHACSNR